MRKQFAVFDIDGTLIRWQLYHATTDALAKAGYLAPDEYDKIRVARLKWKVRGHAEAFKTYEGHVIRAFETIIQNITVKQFESAVDAVIQQYKDQVYVYTSSLIKELKIKGYDLFAVSGSQQELVKRIAAYYGFDDYIGTDYTKREGKFTGEKTFYAQDKKLAVETLMSRHDSSLHGSIAVGDSSSDIPMLELVERAIAFNPEKQLMEYAQKMRWPITVERKNVVYKLETRGGGDDDDVGSYILV